MYREELINVQKGELLDWDIVNTLKNNAMLKVKPELWIEWDFEKNIKSGFHIWEVTKGSNKKVWWICYKCKSPYETMILYRTRGDSCPYCSGNKVNHTNSLASLNPKLASEWHPTKNGDLTPDDVTCGSGKKVWWQCDEAHEWETSIVRRNTKGCRCPYCTNKKILVGYNDMWSTKPDLAALLANLEDGYKHTHFSSKEVDWKCRTCSSIQENIKISTVIVYGFKCDTCGERNRTYVSKHPTLESLNLNENNDE